MTSQGSKCLKKFCLVLPSQNFPNSMETAVVEYGTFIVQAGALLKLIVLLFSFCESQRWSIRSALTSGRTYLVQLKQWCNQGLEQQDRSQQELDMQRCKWTHRLWSVVFMLSLLRLFLRQFDMGGLALQEHDFTILIFALLSLLVSSCPGLINPRSQDVWYMVTILLTDSGYCLQSLRVEVDVRDMIAFALAGHFIYGVLAKRMGCVVFCNLVHLATAILMSRSQKARGKLTTQILFTSLMMFLGICVCRRLIRENFFLRMTLQMRTVEVGAVSSLLTACYDAVVEVDHTLRLSQDPKHQFRLYINKRFYLFILSVFFPSSSILQMSFLFVEVIEAARNPLC